MSIRHNAELAMSEVYTAVFTSRYAFAPNRRATTTEVPMLQPKANAMNSSVTS